MNESTRKQAERAALVHRFQLDALHRALQSLEGHLTALESESGRQRDQLARLARTIADLRVQTGLPRPSEQPRPVTQQQTGDKSPEHHQPSPPGTRAAPRPSRDLPTSLPPPDLGNDWDAYTRNVEKYIADHGIEVAPDPLDQLLPPHRAAEIRRRFDADFGPAQWDPWDYGVVALAVIVGALTDYLLVATPGGTFKGEPQRGSPLTAWMKEQSKKLAPMSGADDIERNAFQQWIAGLTTAAEKWAKVPYDLVIPKEGLTPNVHRLASLGHDPLLGLVFGVGDILSGTCTFIDKSGNWRVIDHPGHKGTRNPLEALVKVVVHGFSDVFTGQGLPAPLMAPFQLVSANSGITLRKGGDPVAVRDVARYMYANGYDLRHFMTAKTSPAIAEAILAAYHGVRACAANPEPGQPGLPDRLKREQMMALTHGLLASANILKTALYGWNPMAINLAQFQTLTKRMLSLVKLAAEAIGPHAHTEDQSELPWPLAWPADGRDQRSVRADFHDVQGFPVHHIEVAAAVESHFPAPGELRPLRRIQPAGSPHLGKVPGQRYVLGTEQRREKDRDHERDRSCAVSHLAGHSDVAWGRCEVESRWLWRFGKYGRTDNPEWPLADGRAAVRHPFPPPRAITPRTNWESLHPCIAAFRNHFAASSSSRLTTSPFR